MNPISFRGLGVVVYFVFAKTTVPFLSCRKRQRRGTTVKKRRAANRSESVFFFLLILLSTIAYTKEIKRKGETVFASTVLALCIGSGGEGWQGQRIYNKRRRRFPSWRTALVFLYYRQSSLLLIKQIFIYWANKQNRADDDDDDDGGGFRMKKINKKYDAVFDAGAFDGSAPRLLSISVRQ